ncbi:MAG TPA: endonuclease/exonuclease/phosphatase family protein [Blastocatellia bacterium]|nr:endonuclease/exonuclease/phosphatase family protein [Blastocatellia bacterium]
MARILVWNIANFGINKINNPLTRPGAGVGGLTLQQASHVRRQLIGQVLLATQPDIIMVIEVSSGDTTPNALASMTGGMSGCIDLLNRLRANVAFAAGQWRLVPPLRIGQGGKAESVGVFFRGVIGGGGSRYFTGPNIWTGGYAGNSVRPGNGVPAAYPVAALGNPDISAMLVMPGGAARAIPAAAQHNGGLNEDRVAARTQFRVINPNGTPDGVANYQAFREPYMVTFVETNGAGVVQRNLTFFVVHSPAVTGNQQVFITYLANTYEVVTPNGGNEARVVCGDFNLNLLDPAGNDAQEYQQLTNNGYNVLLEPVGGPPVNLDPYRGYFATHIKRRPQSATAASKFLWSQNGFNLAYYPSYDYIGSRFVPNFYSIDNILVRPLRGGGHTYDTTIMNPVMGTPFNQVALPPGVPPIGTIPMANGFTNPPLGGWPEAPTAAVYPGIGAANSRCSWANYTHIYSTSDHFALYADI